MFSFFFLVELKAMESSVPPPSQQLPERKTVRPHKDQALNCPRCDSANTKFCYYNNYSLSQPRYFCKSCRRYWTDGGSFRNVPVGGSSRKNKRSSSASSSSDGSKTKPPAERLQQHGLTQYPRSIHQGQDLNLAFPLPSGQDRDEIPGSLSIELPKGNSEGVASMGLSLGSFMSPLPILETSTSDSAGFPLVEFRPSLGFLTSDGFENGYGSLHGSQDSTGAKLFFPVEDLKEVSDPTGSADRHNRQKDDPNCYWNGVLGGGSW